MISVPVFLCYDHSDKRIVLEIKKHLGPLVENGRISIVDYHDSASPGLELEEEINRCINEAQITLLFIGPSLFSSGSLYKVAARQAILRQESKKGYLIPVILRPIHWDMLPIYKLKALPDNGKAITLWRNRDEGFQNVAIGIDRVVEQSNTYGLASLIKETKIMTENFDRFIEAVKSQLQPAARAEHTAATLEQLSVFIPNDVTLADLIVGWQTLSHPSQNEEEARVVSRRTTCGEFAKIASQFTTEEGSLEQAIKTWHLWVKAFKDNNGDKRQVSMAVTFSRELAELQAAARS